MDGLVMPDTDRKSSESETAHVIFETAYPTRPWVDSLPMAATRTAADRDERCAELLARDAIRLVPRPPAAKPDTATNRGRRRMDRELTGAHR